ncbi:MAG: DUF362 domain-containing protein, partial [Syntrophales bacterium]|nr:DUF362 domain-containing protein [Syntrophales bacterium]
MERTKGKKLSSELKDAEPKTPEMTRRDFLKRLGYASGLALAAGGLGLALHDRQGPTPSQLRKALTGLGDYALKTPGPGKMAIVRGTDRKAMVEKGVKALGGIETFIQKGDRVLLKVNAAFATPASLGATTHPEVLAAVADLCLKAGAAQVLVTDNPINNPASCYEISGLAAAARNSGARIIAPSANLFAPVSLPGGKLIRNWPTLAGVFQGVAKVMVLSPVKDHHRAGASMTLKNYYGFLGGRRNVFHQDINGIITELALLLKPTLCVLDGTVTMMTNGPTGGSLSDLKETGTLVVSTDPVAADAVG